MRRSLRACSGSSRDIDRGRRRLLDEVFADWTAGDQATLARLSRRFSDDMFALVDAHARRTPRNDQILDRPRESGVHGGPNSCLTRAPCESLRELFA
jgi:hypothetical protein